MIDLSKNCRVSSVIPGVSHGCAFTGFLPEGVKRGFSGALNQIALTGGGGSGERHFERLATWEEEVVTNHIGTAMGGGYCRPEFLELSRVRDVR